MSLRTQSCICTTLDLHHILNASLFSLLIDFAPAVERFLFPLSFGNVNVSWPLSLGYMPGSTSLLESHSLFFSHLFLIAYHDVWKCWSSSVASTHVICRVRRVVMSTCVSWFIFRLPQESTHTPQKSHRQVQFLLLPNSNRSWLMTSRNLKFPKNPEKILDRSLFKYFKAQSFRLVDFCITASSPLSSSW